MTITRSNEPSPTVAARRLLALAVLSDRLIAERSRLGREQREAMQRHARCLYRSLPDLSRLAFSRHLRERYSSKNSQHRHQHR